MAKALLCGFVGFLLYCTYRIARFYYLKRRYGCSRCWNLRCANIGGCKRCYCIAPDGNNSGIPCSQWNYRDHEEGIV